MKYVICFLVVALLVLHQDDWFDRFPLYFDFWRSTDLVFGFMPKTLLYHAGISVAAAFTWYLATVFAWPKKLQQPTTTKSQEGGHEG